MEQTAAVEAPIRFETHPSRYVHWRLELDPPLARLVMNVQSFSFEQRAHFFLGNCFLHVVGGELNPIPCQVKPRNAELFPAV